MNQCYLVRVLQYVKMKARKINNFNSTQMWALLLNAIEFTFYLYLQYLTKLKRLLPTFFEDFDGHEIESLLGNSTIQALEDWHGLIGMEPVAEPDVEEPDVEAADAKTKEEPTTIS